MTWELLDRAGRQAMRAWGARSRQIGGLHAYSFVGRGTLPPMVLLHGVAESAFVWALVIRHLLPDAGRVFVPELPGHGFSRPPARLTVPGVLDELDEALSSAVSEPAFLIGHSLGAQIAIRFALRHADSVRGLVLLTPGGGTVVDGALAEVKAALDMRTNADARSFVDRVLEKPAWYAPLVAPYVREAVSRPSVRAVVRSAGVADMLTATELGQLRPPIRLLWGCRDRLMPRSDLAHFRAGLPPHAEILEVEAFGHGAHLERPAEVARHVIEFSRRHAWRLTRN